MGSEIASFEYLKQRSSIGKLYRHYILYPRLSRYLSGQVLDYGCGIGDFLHFRPSTIGVDINQHNVDYCVASKQNALLIEKSKPLPFPDETFSGVIMDNVLEHIEPHEASKVLLEIARVLKPRANFLIGVPGTKGYQSDLDHKVMYTKEGLVALMHEFGFTLRKAFYMPLNSQLLDHYLSAHCLYTIFQRDGMQHLSPQ